MGGALSVGLTGFEPATPCCRVCVWPDFGQRFLALLACGEIWWQAVVDGGLWWCVVVEFDGFLMGRAGTQERVPAGASQGFESHHKRTTAKAFPDFLVLACTVTKPLV